MEAIIKQHEEDYDRMVQELFKVREEAIVGRKETDEGVTRKEALFYDLMLHIAFNGADVPQPVKDKCKEVNARIIEHLEGTIGIIGFWEKGHEIKRVKGEITDDILFSGVEELINASDKIASEIMSLAKRRHDQILGKK